MHPMPAGFGEIRSHFACVNGPKCAVSPVCSVGVPGDCAVDSISEKGGRPGQLIGRMILCWTGSAGG